MPKFINEKKELHLLELNDCDFIPDDEQILKPIFGRKHTCPRCNAVTHISSQHPYCLNCHWDSLTDYTQRKKKCA